MAQPSGHTNSSFWMEVLSKTFGVQEQGLLFNLQGNLRALYRKMRPSLPDCCNLLETDRHSFLNSERLGKLDICFARSVSYSKGIVHKPGSFIFKLSYAKCWHLPSWHQDVIILPQIFPWASLIQQAAEQRADSHKALTTVNHPLVNRNIWNGISSCWWQIL